MIDIGRLNNLSLMRRFLNFTLIDDGCWEWAGARSRKGYGRMWDHGCEEAHQVSYRIFKGAIPNGLQVCHTCDNRGCVRPSHLWLGTNSDNQQDSIRKGRNGQLKGEQHANSLLTEEQVVDIFTSHHSGLDLALKHSVHPTTVSAIRTGRLWSWLTGKISQ